MSKLRERSVLEVMVLTFMGTVAFILVASAVIIGIAKVRDPNADVDTITQSVISLTSGILGALLGLLAGRSAAVGQLDQRPDGTDTDLGHPPEEP